MTDLPVAYFVAKRLGLPVSVAIEIPDEALLAMSRHINALEVQMVSVGQEIMHYDLSDDPGYVRVPTERLRSILRAER